MTILTRRYQVRDKRMKRSLTIDVRTGKGEFQAQLNAEHLAELKLATDDFSIRRVPVSRVKPDFSIGRRK